MNKKKKVDDFVKFRIAQIGWGVGWFFAFLLLFDAMFELNLNISHYWALPVGLLLEVSFTAMEHYSECWEVYYEI